MEHLKDYFKNREEVNEFFKNDTLMFDYMGDNMIFFNTLIPYSLNESELTYTLGFYHESGYDFFLYEKIESLDKFQLSSVVANDILSRKSEQMYFATYNDNNKN